jgi:hypothetical protein
MTLFELQEWLGHRTPEATAHYAKITPNTQARAYNDAGYFARNVRTIEVLVDRDAVASLIGLGILSDLAAEEYGHRGGVAWAWRWNPAPSAAPRGRWRALVPIVWCPPWFRVATRGSLRPVGAVPSGR